MSNNYPHYRAYRGKRRNHGTKRMTAGGKIFICFLILMTAFGIRLLFPEFTDSLYTRFFGSSDYASAFSSIGAGLNGEKTMGDAIRDAYKYAFKNTPASEQNINNAVPTLQITEIYNGAKEFPADATSDTPELNISQTTVPVEGTVTSDFGWRVDPIEKVEKFHYGVDILAEQNTEVRAFAAGKVVLTGESTVLGKYVEIEHNGVRTQYAQLGDISVTDGQIVSNGDVIGYTSDRDMHFEIKCGAVYVDPEKYLTWQ